MPGPPEQWQMQPAQFSGGVGYLQPAGHGLKPTAGVAKTVRVLIYLHLAVAVVRVAVNGVLFSRFRGPRAFDDDTFALYDSSAILELLYLLLFLGSGIATMVLLWRMLENGKILAPGCGDHKSHWAITGWLVPFLNLVRPRKIVDQVWVTSRAAGETIPPVKEAPGAGYWWGSWIVFLVGSQLAPSAPFNNPTIEDYANESLGVAISAVLLFVAGLFFLRVLGELQRRHQAALENPWVNPMNATANPFVHGTPTIAPPPPAAQTSPGFAGGLPPGPFETSQAQPVAPPPGDGDFSQPL